MELIICLYPTLMIFHLISLFHGNNIKPTYVGDLIMRIVFLPSTIIYYSVVFGYKLWNTKL